MLQWLCGRTAGISPIELEVAEDDSKDDETSMTTMKTTERSVRQSRKKGFHLGMYRGLQVSTKATYNVGIK